MRKKIQLIALLLISIIGMLGCSTSSNNDDSSGTTTDSVLETYADIVLASYEDSLSTAIELQSAIETLVDNPSEANFLAAKEAWLAARVPYGQTEGYRFSDGPIDDEDGPEEKMNAWPLDEVYIDYVAEDSDSGIINDVSTYPDISEELLINLNIVGGDKNISIGYHAIEFLLWGQDTTVEAGAGQREYTDYVTDGSGTHSNQERRGAYLEATAAILVSDLQSLVDEWSDSSDSNYRATFLSLTESEALSRILRGIGTLASGELSSQRMATALDVRDREEEHSCFSDNTHVDIIENTTSIQNVFLGRYTRIDDSLVSGTGLYDLLLEINPELANTLKTQLETSMTLVNAIEAPFDQEILGNNPDGNARVLSAVNAIQDVGDSIVDAGTALGLTINTNL